MHLRESSRTGLSMANMHTHPSYRRRDSFRSAGESKQTG
jgi:hypothetical protein